MPRRAVFLDRDGVLNRERSFISRPEQLEILPGVIDALAKLGELGYLRLVVTNQSGIARGLFGTSELEAIHEKLLAETKGRLDGIYVCPHHPDFGESAARNCACRKPRPGMLLRAAAEHDLDLPACWLIGDAARDMDAAERAGVKGVLVLGMKIPTKDLYPDSSARPFAFVENLGEAVGRLS